MDQYAIKNAERNIDSFTYPAKLSKDAKRLLAAKYIEMQERQRIERNKATTALTNVRRTKGVGLSELPPAVKALAKKLLKAKEQVKALIEAIRKHNVTADLYSNFYTVSMSEAEYNAEYSKLTEAVASIDAQHHRETSALVDVARGLADAQIEQVKARIAKNNPELVAQLDAIGQKPALPEAKVEVKKISKGRSQ